MTIWRWATLAAFSFCLLLFWPLRGCGSGRPTPVQEIVFLGPGERWVRAGALDRRFDAEHVSLEIQSKHGRLRREIVSTDDGGLMVWAAWSDDGARLFVLSCGMGTPDSIDTIDAERSGRGSAKEEAEERLVLAMRRHFEDPYLKKTSSAGQAVS